MGEVSDKHMATGLHTVSDIYCIQCASYVGWTYIKAFEEDQKYKEGKFILEKKLFKEVSK
jgi:hypothetical protein